MEIRSAPKPDSTLLPQERIHQNQIEVATHWFY